MGPIVWQEDSATNCCTICQQEFTFTKRKHHCRRCGRIVCDPCSQTRLTLPQSGEIGRVRVCDECAAQIHEQGEEAVRVVQVPPSPLQPTRSLAMADQNQPGAVPIPVATIAPVKHVAAVPVAASAPKLIPPTAAPISAAVHSTSSTSNSGGGGLFAGLASRLTNKVNQHAPGLVAAVREQIAAAASKQEAEEAEKKAHSERLIAAATATSAPPVTASAATVTQPANAANIAHIPGLGPIALAAPVSAPSDEKKAAVDAQVWSQLQQPPVQPEPPAPSTPPLKPQPSADSSQLASSPSVAADNELRRRGKSNADLNRASSLSSSSVSGGEPVSSQPFKLDLPLRLCLVILKKTSSEMRDKYTEYLSTKLRRQDGDEPLSFSQFMFFSTIKTLPDFLFKKTELAYCMMREEGDTLVFLDNFRRYAPILSPLASKLDAEQLYYVLEQASLNSGAALSEEQVEEEEAQELEEAQSTDEITNTSPPPSVPRVKRKAGGIGYPQFKIYVDHLKKYTRPDSQENGWPDFRSMLTSSSAALPNGMDKHEQLLVVRSGVTDTTTFPPHIGRLGLTSNFLLYEGSIFNRRRCIRWSSIVRIERNDEGFWRKGNSSSAASSSSSTASPAASSNSDAAPSKGFKIFILDEESSAEESRTVPAGVPAAKKEHCLTMDIPGWSQETQFERVRTFEYIKMMIHLHKLVASIPDKVVASALIQETCATMQRMRALEAVGHGANPLLLNPFDHPAKPVTAEDPTALTSPTSPSTSFDPTSPASSSFVSSIRASIDRAETIRKSKSSWLFAVLPGLQNKVHENLSEDIDPELSAGQSYKTAEELLKLSQAHEQPFTLKNFAYNVKLFRHEIEPAMLFIALIRRVRDWENPIVTLMTMMLLLNMSYRDYLMYLPALFVLFNILLLAVLKYYPNAVWVWLGGAAQEAAAMAEKNGPPAAGVGGVQIEEIGPDGQPIRPDIAAKRHPHLESKDEFESSPSASTGKSSIPTAQPVAQPIHSPGNAGATHKSKEDEGGLFQKLKNYRDVAVKTKDYLHSVQNSIGEHNIRFMKLEGLYKWRSPLVTQKFFMLLCGVFLVLVFIPFRYLFPFIVIDFFTTKWQRQGSLERLLEEVALPPRMPDLD